MNGLSGMRGERENSHRDSSLGPGSESGFPHAKQSETKEGKSRNFRLHPAN